MRTCNATRANGQPCRAPAVTDDDKCVHHRDGKKPGAQAKLTPEIADKLVSLIRAGNYISVAVRAVGISRALFYQWLDRGSSDASRDREYRALRESVERAKAEAEARAVAAIAAASRDNWQAAAWLLERQYPERWGRVSVRMRDEQTPAVDGDETAIDNDDPFKEVDELAERRRTRAT